MDVEQILKSLPSELHFKYKSIRSGSLLGNMTLLINNHEILFQTAVKKIQRRENLERFEMQDGDSTILICNALTPYLQKRCNELSINYIDTAGNIRIVKDSVFIMITGCQIPKEERVVHRSKIMSIGVVKCTFALIAEHNLLQKNLQEIAEKSGISTGMAHKSIKYLEDNQFLIGSKGDRQLINEKKLLYTWIENYLHTLATRQNVKMLPVPDSWENIELKKGALWTGEVAAHLDINSSITGDLLLYSQSVPTGYKKSEHKNCQFYCATPFWGDSLRIGHKAKAVITIADLISTGSERGQHIAEAVNQHCLQLEKLPYTK